MSGNDSGTMETVGRELGQVFEPLVYAVNAGPGGVFNFLRAAGVYEVLGDEEGDRVAQTIDERIADPLSTIDTKLLSTGSPSPSDIEDVIEAVGTLFEGFEAMNDLELEADDAAAIGDQIVDYLVVEYLYREHRQVHNALGLAGLIRDSPPNDPGEIRLEEFAKVLDQPETLVRTAFQWPDNFQGYLLQWYLRDVLRGQGVSSTLVRPELDEVRKLADDSTIKPKEIDDSLRVPLVSGTVGSLGVESFPLPETDTHYPGIAVAPYGVAKGQVSENLGGGWRFQANFSAEAGWGLVLQPNKDTGKPEFAFRPVEGDFGGSVEGSAELGFDPAAMKRRDTDTAVLFGDAGGSYFGINGVGVRASVSYDGDFSFSAATPVMGEVVIDPQGGFLEKLIPKAITSEFELTPGYSMEKGLFFDGSAKLKIPISLNRSIGPVTIAEVYVELEFDPETGTIEPTIAVSADGELGPIATSVKRLGLDGSVAFPENRDGNLGVADLGVDFKPPSGAGLSLDTGPISGGGYLEYDVENERYAGVFDVTIGPVDVKVMGLLTTEMPDGSDGFSMLLSVFGEFPPVQLGFGFTLNGLGGVIGVNRALKSKPLRKATRSGSLDSVLFPEDPVAHAQRIVSDLRTIYPPTRGKHVFGPMARFGWGTPSIIRMDLGIVLQIPPGKVAIVGNVAVGLPAVEIPKEAQIVRLNLSATGIIDPERQLFSLDAALYDSRVVLWSVKGGMAMRLGWGDDPRFVLAIGGFNPRFEPPEKFPKLQRVTVSLDIPGGRPSVTWKGYFATTSNTVQVGASFDAKFEAGPVSAHAWWGLDALFQFNPFKFVVDFEAGLAVVVFGFELSISLNGTIKGPAPVHIEGQLKISLPGPIPDPSPHVNITIGEGRERTEQLPVADVLPKFGKELAKPANWSAQVPADGTGVVSLREIDAGDDAVLAHPMGRVSVRQTLVPVGKTIDRFGDNRPKHVEFDFEVSTAGDELPPVDRDEREEFAPEQYRAMSNSEKMNAPTFRRWAAGRAVGGDLFHWGCTYRTENENGDTVVEKKTDNAATAKMEYEHTRIDGEVERALDEAQKAISDGGGDEDEPTDYPVEVARTLADDGAVANADSRWRGTEKFVPQTDDETVEIGSNYGDLEEVDVASSVENPPVETPDVDFDGWDGGETS